jgi:hypothetical protein
MTDWPASGAILKPVYPWLPSSLDRSATLPPRWLDIETMSTITNCVLKIRTFRLLRAKKASNRDGEYIFIFEYVDDISVIVGQCQVSIVTGGRIASVSDLVEPALEIGRTVGCSPYENDFVPPEIPDRWRQITWGSPPFPPFRPPPPQ